ncbi:MAG: helix-turn-helix domain-containing protein [Thermoplasmatota archaeon]
MRPGTPSGERNRATIMAYVEAHPGASFRQLVRGTGIASGTVYHHLARLSRLRRLYALPISGRLAHFPGPRPAHDQERLSALAATLDSLDRTLLWSCSSTPCHQALLIAGLPHVPRSNVQHRLGRLVHYGLLTSQRSGRRIHYTTAINVSGVTL